MMISILLSFLFVNSVQSAPELIELDNIAANLLAIGDKSNKLPVNGTEASALCDKYNQLLPVATDMIHPLFHRYSSNQINKFMSPNTICQMYKEFPNDTSLFAAEVNAKSYLMSESYHNINNLLGYVAQGAIGHEFCKSNSSQIACLLHKWYNEVNDLLSEASQKMADKLFDNYLNYADDKEPKPNCTWSDVPRAKYIQFKATNLNFIVARFNCLPESQH